MLRNYFKTAFRSLVRNKNYAIINITGLAAGIMVCLAIFMIIQFELSFEDYHQKKDRIYRVLTEYHHADADVFYGKGVPRALPTAVKTTFPQIEKAAILYSEYDPQIAVLDDAGKATKKFKEKGLFLTEPSLFDIFDFKWLAGTAASLKDPNNAVLTRELAEKYFGNWKNAIGKSIKWNNGETLRVTGVLENNPANTDLQLNIVVAFGTGYTARFQKSTDWDGTSFDFGYFVLLRPGVSETTMNTQLRALSKKMKSPDNNDSHILEALQKIHYSKIGTFSGKSMSMELIKVLWLIAAFILLIACVNFVNLATAQAINRSKEVGVRKVLGSNKSQLKLQFIAETFLIVLTAVVLAALVSIPALPLVSKLLDLPLSAAALLHPAILIFLLIVTVVVTALAGFYPSIVLSRFNPITALKNKITASGSKGISLRRGLVVFQFIIAQVLIIGTLIIVKQMNYFNNQSLGFEKEGIVNIPFPGDSAGISKLTYLQKELSAVNGIQRVSFSSNTPVEDNNDNWTKVSYNHAEKPTDFYSIDKTADQEYVPTYNLPLVAGRNLTRSDTTNEFLVNEELVKSLGISDPHEVLNKEMTMEGGQMKGTIVGVLKNFNNRSFRTGIAPLIIHSMKNWYNQAGIKLTYKNAPAGMQAIEKIWNSTFPDFVFEYKFLDDKVASFYEEENKLSNLYKIFAAIAIFLSCLGLYGLASFMAVQRIKEVGIRKVLGATAGNIVYLFSKEFIVLIGIAFLVATPIAWYFMNQWLQDYTYRIDVSWWIFLVGGIMAVVIALATVSVKAIKAGMANPVKSLRSE
jgi:putative ABC transport system permease protein